MHKRIHRTYLQMNSQKSSQKIHKEIHKRIQQKNHNKINKIDSYIWEKSALVLLDLSGNDMREVPSTPQAGELKAKQLHLDLRHNPRLVGELPWYVEMSTEDYTHFELYDFKCPVIEGRDGFRDLRFLL